MAQPGPMPGPAELEEVENSRVERLLAVGLVIFLLVGGFWVLARLGEIPERPDWAAIEQAEGKPAVEEAWRQAMADYERAQVAAGEAAAALTQARAEYEYRREEYRFALERGLDDPALAEAYAKARTAMEQAAVRYEVAEAARVALEARLKEPQQAYDDVMRRVQEAYERADARYQLAAFALRFGYALPLFGLSVWGWFALRRRRSRHLILATAVMAFAGIQTLGLLGQYGWYLLRDVAPLALSVAGSAVCVAGLVAVRRWALNPRRLAVARLRRGQCPLCGFPLQAGATHCVGCGRRVVEACPGCENPNVTGSPFCGHCGRALS
ncbi:MAG: zinc ribbon domain-containing protein [Firmicutes bacterium]|nr:zinc ribbon domain-containing protein [Bacillota bacterium]